MKNITLIALMALALSNDSLSQDNIDENIKRDRRILLEDSSASAQPSLSELNKFPEIYQVYDSVIQGRNESSGLISDPHNTKSEATRVSLSYGFSQDYEDLTKIQTFDLTYHRRFKNSYQDLWWGAQIESTTAKYGAIADERVSTSGDPNSVANLIRDNQLQLFTIFGLGVGHRFKTLSSLFNSHRIFEMVSVFGNYVLHGDSTDNQTYNGYGYSAEYSLNYKSTNSFFYGGKLSYNWALVEKAAVDQEALSDRSLVFGWTSFAIEFGYYY